MNQDKYEWRKCFKIDGTPPIEVFENFVRVFDYNYEIEELKIAVESTQRNADFYKEALRKWQEEFGNIKSK